MPRFILVRHESRYGLKDVLSPQHPLCIDFSSPQLKHRLFRGGKRELLLKATAAKPGQRVWDCTAGLGVDSLLLAKEGCEVTMFERSTILSLMLKEALAKPDSEELKEITERMTLIEEDAALYLKPGSDIPDVIVLDPMFPVGRKSANVKGDMQILQRFLPPEENIAALLQLAIRTGCPRVVVKRPATGGDIEDFQPSFSLSAKANRFDVFLNP